MTTPRDSTAWTDEARSTTDGPWWELPLAALLALLATLVLGRASLDTPYWWDAAAVYVPGSRWVMEHDFAAVPGVFPSLLHRGHTTLFYVITAGAFRLFGGAPPVGHAVVLGFSCAGVACTYGLGARLFGRPAGVVAAVLLLVAPLWLTMSSQVLPEIPLAALTAASLLAMSRGRYGAAALLGVLVVLTKETGVACPLAIVGALLLWAWRARRWAELARPLAVSAVPVLVLAGWFVLQRVTEGWWVLPYHAELFGLEHDYLAQGGGVLKSMLLADGRWIALVVALPLGLWRWRAARETFLAPDPWAAPTDPKAGPPPRWVTVAALVLVFLANQGFFTQMWFLERYALAAHPGLCVLLAAGLTPAVGVRAARGAWTLGLGAVLATCIAAGLSLYAGNDYASGETTFRYLRMVEAHQRAYAHLEAERAGGDAPLVLSAWPMTEELRYPWLGWVAQPYETIGWPGYRDDREAVLQGRTVDAVITAEGLGSHDGLSAEARRLGMTLRERIVVGGADGAVVEVWLAPR